jgi:hypothetical protein
MTNGSDIIVGLMQVTVKRKEKMTIIVINTMLLNSIAHFLPFPIFSVFLFSFCYFVLACLQFDLT